MAMENPPFIDDVPITTSIYVVNFGEIHGEITPQFGERLAGGVRREFFQVLIRRLFDESLDLLV